MDRQRNIERFLHAAHRLAVSRLRADPGRIAEVQALLHRWREQSGCTRSDRYCDECEKPLAMPIDEFERVICAEDEHAIALRSASPIGVLISEQRAELLRQARGA